MQVRKLGQAGPEVTVVGFGSAEIGFCGSAHDEAAKILHGVLDAGINLIDTAACYADSEEKIGQAVSSRRDEYVLVTKCGHKVEGLSAEEWTPEVVSQSIDQSLRRLRTDHVDVVLLHSCAAEKLTDDLLAALRKAKESGKSRLIGYSGDGEDALAAVGMGVFDVLETSVSICDQQCLTKYVAQARNRGLGVLAKRAIANGCWRGLSHFDGFYSEYVRPYAERLEQMGLTPEAVGFDGPMVELALRFSAFAPGVSAVVVGSTNVGHLKKDIEIVQKGPLPEEVFRKIRDLWLHHDDGSWTGQT